MGVKVRKQVKKKDDMDQLYNVTDKRNMNALLIGATGATGKDILEQLLADNACTRVDIFVRRVPGISHTKLNVHVVDFNRPETWQDLVKGDVLFSCLGTTLKVAGSKEAQWVIDHDYQLAFAEAARKNRVPYYVLVSSTGASASSSIFYSRMKGQLEDRVKALGFDRVVIFRPPLLIRKGTDRLVERIMKPVLELLNGFGLLRAQKPLHTEVLAKAMIASAKEATKGVFHLDGAASRELAEQD